MDVEGVRCSVTELQEATGEALLRAFASLTHRLHAIRHARDKSIETKIRAERNLVEAEILRRMRQDD